MTESEWLACTDPNPMLDYLAGKAGRRKLRLYSCACCRRVVPFLKRTINQLGLRLAELHADGLIGDDVIRLSAQSNNEQWRCDESDNASEAVTHACQLAMEAIDAKGTVNCAVPLACRRIARRRKIRARQAKMLLLRYMAQLLRHVVGNPFRSSTVLASYPALAVQLASEVYAGHDSALALHDALIDAGQAELAEHFRDAGQWHPKGCWAIDLILSKIG